MDDIDYGNSLLIENASAKREENEEYDNILDDIMELSLNYLVLQYSDRPRKVFEFYGISQKNVKQLFEHANLKRNNFDECASNLMDNDEILDKCDFLSPKETTIIRAVLVLHDTAKHDWCYKQRAKETSKRIADTATTKVWRCEKPTMHSYFLHI